ncbi:MAG: glutamate-5-semialdehyde dehydrogenase [Coriobacteriia bacterium]|nr:glutamate-5-semialdehyde dehydrogenase [Coriobacteriia bacterium]MCL2537691.1 glutamate-5-semialdehyde dehydrogenase [Coriobacteriia bacterium]
MPDAAFKSAGIPVPDGKKAPQDAPPAAKVTETLEDASGKDLAVAGASVDGDVTAGLALTDADSVEGQALAARAASKVLAKAPIEQRNAALVAMAAELKLHENAILTANGFDIESARDEGIEEGLIDRLMLNPERLAACRHALAELVTQPDVIGEIIEGRTITAGIKMKQVRVPLGVVGMIYEARPNVTIDAASIAIKTGNAILLRGGKIAARTNEALADILQTALVDVGLPADGIQNLDASSRESGNELMQLHGIVDVLIPRGGAGLIKNVVENSKVPVIETGTGNCHIYLHEDADPDMAYDIVMNAKCQRPSVCNAAESLLVDLSVARKLLPRIMDDLVASGVMLVCGERTLAIAHEAGISKDKLMRASEEDWGREYLDMTLSVKIVEDLDVAIAHINKYGTSHSEAIVTTDYHAAQKFTQEIDAAAVYVNASTRFTDGGVFGLGAEIGISTQKLHARGPMGATALTSTKFILEGNGQIRS